MENISETKRGRPAVVSAELEATFTALGLFTNCHTRRSKVNVFYRQRALSVLRDGDFKWLFDEVAIMAETGGDKHWRPVILTELGRIEDEDAMQRIAAELCETKPKTRDAVLMVRRWRTGSDDAAGDPLKLANEVIASVNDFMKRFPKTSKEQVKSALLTALDSVQQASI
jgi:hypothetical protein